MHFPTTNLRSFPSSSRHFRGLGEFSEQKLAFYIWGKPFYCPIGSLITKLALIMRFDLRSTAGHKTTSNHFDGKSPSWWWWVMTGLDYQPLLQPYIYASICLHACTYIWTNNHVKPNRTQDDSETSNISKKRKCD